VETDDKIGNGNVRNSIATFLVDYSGPTVKVLHGPTDKELKEELGLSIP
jgi:hypothetical protein